MVGRSLNLRITGRPIPRPAVVEPVLDVSKELNAIAEELAASGVNTLRGDTAVVHGEYRPARITSRMTFAALPPLDGIPQGASPTTVGMPNDESLHLVDAGIACRSPADVIVVSGLGPTSPHQLN